MRIGIHLTPNASKNEITGREDSGIFRIKVQSPPVDGAANKRLIMFLAKTTGVPKSKVRIIKGNKSRNKIVEIDGDEKTIIRCLEKKK